MSKKQKKNPTARSTPLSASMVRNQGILQQYAGTPDIEALYKKGTRFINDGDLTKATEIFTDILRKKPDHLMTIEQMIVASSQLKRFDSAEIFIQALIELAPLYSRAYGYASTYYIMQKQIDKAAAYLKQGLAIAPDDPVLLSSLAGIYHRKGNSEEAGKLYRQAYDLEPTLINLMMLVKHAHKFKSTDDPVFQDILQFNRRESAVAAHHKYLLHMVTAKAYEQLKEYDFAFENYKKCNDVIRKSLKYDVLNDGAFFKKQMLYFTEEFMHGTDIKGNPSAEPVFIIGMPRSGSTLLEQMLDSHPDVIGVGEAEIIPDMIAKNIVMPPHPDGKPYSNRIDKKTPGSFDLDTAAQKYLDFLHSHGKAVRYVDKELLNFRFVGQLALMFPNAKFIHSMRHPLDCCLSCYQHVFNGNAQEYSYNLQELGIYYRLYREMMEFWHTRLPGRILDVEYEQVVESPEIQLRKILDFIGLPFDPACLEFYKNERIVFTSSAGQVSQPIYKSAKAKWKNYGKNLIPLVRTLGPCAPEDCQYLLENQ
jgi:tetratricopeptide (TPR) repeat protein